MKKIIILIALVMLGIAGANAQSMLKVRLADGSRINISLNGRYFNKQGQTITVGDLPPGRQHLKIFRIAQNRWGRGYEELVYQGPVRTNYGMVTVFEYDPYTRMTDVQELEMNRNTPPPSHMNGEPGNTANMENNGRGITDNIPQNEANAVQAPLPPGTPAASPIAEGKTGSLTETKLQKLKSKTEAKATDTEKMKVLKDGLKNEQITTYDVSLMMDWFLFESSKVDFAAWAYNITVDHELYQDLDAKLKNNSSKGDLDNFIKSKQ